MGIRASDIVATIILYAIRYAYAADHILSCNVTALEPCGRYQICNETSSECACIEGYVRVGADCLPAGDLPATSHATAALAAVFTLALILCGLFLVVRRYNLVEYVRQKVNLRRNQDVMYEDVMIGQDDPPLSP